MSVAGPDLRDRLAELEVEHATLLSELRAFESDYLRRVGVIDVQVQELEARILALAFARPAWPRTARRRMPPSSASARRRRR